MRFICLMTLNFFTLFFNLLHYYSIIFFQFSYFFINFFFFFLLHSLLLIVSYPPPPPKKKSLISLLFSSYQPFISFPTRWWLIEASTSSPSPNSAIIFSIKFLFPYLLSFTPSNDSSCSLLPYFQYLSLNASETQMILVNKWKRFGSKHK